MTSIPEIVPPLPIERSWKRHLPASASLVWLRAGWKDLWTQPWPSLAYGALVFLVSLAVVYAIFQMEWDYILFPALAGFMVVGPALAVGLYEKSRRLAAGEKVSLGRMILVQAGAGGQVLFIGAILLGLMLLWMRAAVLLYALFFGLLPFPGLGNVAATLFMTPIGLSLLAVGGAIGGLFAAFAFAISAFSLPMLLEERIDAFTAMGHSTILVWNNLPVLLAWGALVLGLVAIAIATGLVGLIVVFPLLGHATWHAYKAIR
jgi:uncharacterized membrane protein